MVIPDFQDHLHSDTNLPHEVEVARLRVTVPRTLRPLHTTDGSRIRAPASNRGAIITFIQSLRNQSPRIILSPTMSLAEDDAILVDIAIRSETSDIEGEDESQMFWDSVAQQFAYSIADHLGIAIEDQLAW